MVFETDRWHWVWAGDCRVTSCWQGVRQVGEEATEGAWVTEQDAHQGTVDTAEAAVHCHRQDDCNPWQRKTAGREGGRKGRKEEKVKTVNCLCHILFFSSVTCILLTFNANMSSVVGMATTFILALSLLCDLTHRWRFGLELVTIRWFDQWPQKPTLVFSPLRGYVDRYHVYPVALWLQNTINEYIIIISDHIGHWDASPGDSGQRHQYTQTILDGGRYCAVLMSNGALGQQYSTTE